MSPEASIDEWPSRMSSKWVNFEERKKKLIKLKFKFKPLIMLRMPLIIRRCHSYPEVVFIFFCFSTHTLTQTHISAFYDCILM